jgi:Cu(I)/Ag(I) efflux system membrane fusion protein
MSAAPLSRTRLVAAAAAIALIGAGAGYGLANLKASKPASNAGPPAASAGQKVLYWYDPMVPAQHFDKPGKSPMGMEMVPRYAEGGGAAAAGVTIDPAAVQSLGVRLASVERGDFAQGLDAPGVLDFDQRNVAIVQARAAGFVERTYARAPGDVVRAGAPIADLLVPTWGGAQTEYLAVRATGDAKLDAAARQRLRLLGMSDGLIDQVAKSGRTHGVITITTPVGGVIQTLDVRQGMSVNMGQTLAQVTGLSTVWLNAAVPEGVGGSVRIGQSARADLSAFPGESFTGRVAAVLPTAQAESRTLTVRVELPNRGGRLRPGMFATVHLSGEVHPALFVPSEAVIRTGKRSLVMVAANGGRFQPVEVQLGRESGDRIEILAGLDEGQKVVASGQFLIDSEASLAGVQARPLATASASASTTNPPKTSLYESRGRIEALTADTITLSHEAVPAIGWPAMTMTFKLGSPALAKAAKVGDRVSFAFEQKPDGPILRRLSPAAAQ